MNSPKLGLQVSASGILPNNSVSHIAAQRGVVFIGTSKGLARTNDGGATWESFRGTPEFLYDGIYSFGVRGTTIWAATGFNKPVKGDESRTVQTGSGYAFSLDNGATWRHVNQPLDAQDDSVVQYGSNRISFRRSKPEDGQTFCSRTVESNSNIRAWPVGIELFQELSTVRSDCPNSG